MVEGRVEGISEGAMTLPVPSSSCTSGRISFSSCSAHGALAMFAEPNCNSSSRGGVSCRDSGTGSWTLLDLTGVCWSGEASL